MEDEEVWKPVPGWPGYEVSSLGRVRSAARVVECEDGRRRRYQGRVLRTQTHQDGYPQVTLSVGGAASTRGVHRLVAEAFHGPPPFEGALVMHLDDDPLEQRPEQPALGNAAGEHERPARPCTVTRGRP